MDIRKILTDFAKHLNDSGQLKKGTAISDEVKYYLETKAENLLISGVSVSESQIEELFPFEDENNASMTRPIERITKYNGRQADRREGAKRLLELLRSR